MESNHKLEKAKRDYPKGTKFISPTSGIEYTSTGVFEQSDYSKNIYCQYPSKVDGAGDISICIYRGCRDQWAEVVTQNIAA